MLILAAHIAIGLSLSLSALYALMVLLFPPGARQPAMPAARPLPRVSILKPVKNRDAGLEKNLESFFTLDYPAYEIIFGVDCETDPCTALLNDFRSRYPGVTARIVATGTDKPLNPKVHTLIKTAAVASGMLYWVSDANTRVETDTLKSLVAEHLRSGAAIVFSPISGSGSASFGSIIENSYLNHFVSGNILGGWKLFRKAIIVGKSMLIEKAALESLGGFERFRQYLAEDYMMGEIFVAEGRPVATNAAWVTNICSASSIGDFCSRMTRWAKMRFRIDPLFYALELFGNPVGLALLLIPVAGKAAAGLLPAVLFSTMIIEYAAFFAAAGGDRKKPAVLLLLPAAAAVKAVLLLAVYFVPFFCGTVNWRGRRLRIGRKSRILEY